MGGVDLLLELGNPFRLWGGRPSPDMSWLSGGVSFVVLLLSRLPFSVIPRLEIFLRLAPLDNSLVSGSWGWIAGLCCPDGHPLPCILLPLDLARNPVLEHAAHAAAFYRLRRFGRSRIASLLTPYASAPSQVALLAVALVVIDAAMVAIYSDA